MHICKHLLRVIFLLSTIVVVTDCCSSRILLLREHTLKIVHHHKLHNNDQHNHQQQPQHEKIPQHVNIGLELTHNKNYSTEHMGGQNYMGDSGSSNEEESTLIPIIEEPYQIDSTTTYGVDGLNGTNISNSSDIAISDTYLSETNFNGSTFEEWSFNASSYNQSFLNDKTFKETTSEMLPATNASSTLPDELGTLSVSTTVSTSDKVVQVSPQPNTNDSDSTTVRDPQIPLLDVYYTIMRDVLSFQCYGQYLTEFCLNGGRCFRYPMGNQSFFSCECADGYVGERCESKSLNQLYTPAPSIDPKPPPKILMARVVLSFPMLIVISVIYMIFGAIIVFRNPKKQRYREDRASGMLEEGGQFLKPL